MHRGALLGWISLAAAACGSSGSGAGAQPTDAGAHDRLMDVACDGCAPSAPMGTCGAVVQQRGIEGATHVPLCTIIDYGTNPPSSGDHYPPPYWAAYKTYTSPVPEGFWVHDLEHGAIVLTYNCAVGTGDATECAGEVAAAQQMIDGLPSDPACVELAEGVSRRTVMTPDPKLVCASLRARGAGRSGPIVSMPPYFASSPWPTTTWGRNHCATMGKTP